MHIIMYNTQKIMRGTNMLTQLEVKLHHSCNYGTFQPQPCQNSDWIFFLWGQSVSVGC